jgi:hypothetical protein
MCPTAALRANSLTTPTSLRSSPLLIQEGCFSSHSQTLRVCCIKAPLLIQESLSRGFGREAALGVVRLLAHLNQKYIITLKGLLVFSFSLF